MSERERDAARAIVLCGYLYPNYRVDSRGPRGCLYDALTLLAPEVAQDVGDIGWDAAYDKHFRADEDVAEWSD